MKWCFTKTRQRNNALQCGNAQGYLLLQFSVQHFCTLFAIKKFTFCGARLKRILAWERGTSKRWFLDLD